MSEKELNSYRFISGIEPSDEMLAQIMREVANDAKERNAAATASYIAEMRRQASEVKAEWRERINAALRNQANV